MSTCSDDDILLGRPDRKGSRKLIFEPNIDCNNKTMTSNSTRMKATKTATEIMVKDEVFFIEQGTRETTPPKIVTLASKIDEYVLKIGYSNTHVMSVVVQLLTLGKVRLDFRDYSERLELLDPTETMSRPQAATVFDSHMNSIRKDDPSLLTQKIIIQPPRVNLPKR